TIAKKKEQYSRLNAERPAAEYLARWQARLAESEAQAHMPFEDSLETLAKRHGPELGVWYTEVYRLACDPAHLGDVPDFTPSPDGDFRFGGHPALAMYRVLLAAHYGLAVVIETFRLVSGANDLGIRAPVETLQARLDAIGT